MQQQVNSTQSLKHRHIGVVLGGTSPECDVSRKSGAAMAAALERLGYRVTRHEAGRGLAEDLVRAGVEVAMLAVHGVPGEDGTVQGLLELLGIPYTGSGVLASALAMNKAAAKKIFVYHGLPTPSFEVLPACAADGDVRIGLAPPFVVKPCEGGSSIGTGIVRDRADAQAALKAAAQGGDILVEAYMQGRELTVGVLNGQAFPAIEVLPREGFYDYEAKYNSGGATRYNEHPELPPGLHERLQELAETVYAVLGCAGAARVDFIVTAEAQPGILEINTIPGMTETSLLPMAARQAGLSFDGLVERILHAAALHTGAGRRCAQ